MVRGRAVVLRLTLASLGAAAAIAAAAAAPADAHAAFSQAWPAFALVAGLLLVGAAAAADGVFEAAGARMARAPGGPVVLLAGLLLLDALVTVVLNLDTAVVFMTLSTWRARRSPRGSPRRGLRPSRSPSRSPRSRSGPRSGSAPVGTATRARGARARSSRSEPRRCSCSCSHDQALPVLALGIAVALGTGIGVRGSLRAASPLLLLGVLGVAVALGALARAADVGHLVVHAGRWETSWVAAAAAVLVNNLPAAVMLSAHLPDHPRALLLGLDLGPNLAVTGSLSAVLWHQVATASGARPSVVRYTLYGVVLAPLPIAAALLVTSV